MGWVEWKIQDYMGQVAMFRTQAYYVPEAHIRIASPQHHFKLHQRGHGEFNCSRMALTTVDDLELNFPYSPNNLPQMFLNDLHTLCSEHTHADITGVTSCMIHEVLTMDILQRS
jgi:hypothetical protein